MTEAEAINILQLNTPFVASKEANKAVDVAIKALEKQIPKKPIDGTHDYNTYAKMHENMRMIYCPSCNERLKLKSKGKHCDKCGQKLDWSEV